MPKRREQIRMSEEEMWAFIESQKSIQVATINKDGSPHLMVLWFAITDRKIVLETFTKSQKVVNLKRDPSIARGNHLRHYLNNRLILDFTDNDPRRALLEGVLALQLHAGRPMWVEFKNIRMKAMR